MKKTISLILAIVLSMTVFFTNISGIIMIARAQDVFDGGDSSSETSSDQVSADQMGEDSDGWDAEWEEIMRQAAEEEEARQAAYEEAAREAEEEARKAAEQAEYEEAIRKAEEEQKKAEEARRAQEEKEKAEQDSRYSLSISAGSAGLTNIDFGAAYIGEERDYVPLSISNVGNNAVDLIYTESGDADGAFSISVRGDKVHLEPGESAGFYVSMSSRLGQGTYNAVYYFADANRDPGFTRGVSVPVKGSVIGETSAIKSVVVSPSKATIAVGCSYRFNVVVSGTGNYNDDVVWYISGEKAGGTYIDDDGVLTVASNETSGNIKIYAASLQDGTKTGSASVSLQRNSYNVNAYADPANGGGVSGGGAVTEGGSVTISAAPNKNYYFAGWYQDGKKVSTSTNYTIKNVKSNINIAAKFAQNYVTVKAEPNNSDAGNVVGGGNITYGGSTTLSAKAYNGYVFTGWKEGDTIISRDASLKLNNLTADRKITAIFAKTTHTLTIAASPVEGGSVSGAGTYQLGQSATIKATPASGYEFREWQVNNQVVSRDANYKIDKIEHDYTITAVFVKKGITSFEISAGVATTGGSISPSGKSLVAQGQNVTYTITPKTGYGILAVAVDGNQVGAVKTYTFTNVQGPHTISAAFVQTDKSVAANSTTNTASATVKKVEPVKKTTSNTATATSTVKIEDAAEGLAGDDYVEEMEDLESIAIPTDEQLGVTEASEDEVYSEVTKMLGVSMSEVKNMIEVGNIEPVVEAAFYTGVFNAYDNNDFEPKSMTQMSADYQNMSREELMLTSHDAIMPSLTNLSEVVNGMLTKEDVLTMAQGGKLDFAISLTKEDGADAVTERIMKNAVGQKPLQYFDLTMLKSSGGYTEKITELPVSMEVVIEIPDEIYKSGKTYSVLRVHNGQLSLLPDLDDDPKTITFRTDRFSAYAIAQEVATSRSLVMWLCGGALVAFGIALTCFLILISHQRKWRKAHKHGHA